MSEVVFVAYGLFPPREGMLSPPNVVCFAGTLSFVFNLVFIDM